MNGEQDIKRIHVLDKKVSELIAAGEVVERPASAVKELLENAVDAGATAITLEIKNGGVTFIRVTDNGGGIMRDDVSDAFLRHATSKVLTAEDLTAIGTLGFRGEALASIAAVSRIELITRTAGELAGTSIRLDGGEIVETGDAGCPQGTTIIVRELFYNTPARMKFLKKDVTEGAAVAAVAQRIALSHPEISLRFIKDGREELHTPGDNRLISAIHCVLGREFSASLIETGYTLGRIRVSGYISKPAAARHNRNMQFFFLNGRLVRSKTMMAALEEACKGSVMVGRYPGCVLHLDMNPSLADINVHPAKLEVRFANEHEIFEAVYYAVKKALHDGDERPPLEIAPQKPVNTEFTGYEKPTKPHTFTMPEITSKADSSTESTQLRMIIENTPTIQEQESTTQVFSTAHPVYEHQAMSYMPVTEGNRSIDVFPDDEKAEESVMVSSEAKSEPVSVKIEAVEKDCPPRVIGQCFSTYILAEYNGSLWIIDKHAAHERILYEQIKFNHKSAGQLLLEPVTAALPADEYAAVLENLELFSEAGFAVEDFGGSSVIVREAPLDLAGCDAAALISELAGSLAAHKRDMVAEKLDWIYHSTACRAAIKAGDRTTEPEMRQLAERILRDRDIMYCPHGRPVAFELKKSEMEKKFGR